MRRCSKVCKLIYALKRLKSLPKQNQTLISKHRSVPIADSKVQIVGYPTKLVLFRQAARPFYWARYFVDGKMIKRSTKTDSKRLSYSDNFFPAANAFFVV